MTKQNWIYTFLFLIIGFGILGIYGHIQKKDLNENSSYTCGKIYYYGRTSKGGTVIGYEYNCDGINFKSSDGLGYFSDCEKTGWCIGKCYEIRYSSKNPKNSRINFEEECNCSPQLKN